MTVYLVGAGPGDPGLLTVRGADLLAVADVVLYDSLAEVSLLDQVRADAEIVFVGKRPGAPMPQEEINELLVGHGQAGRVVVRLKGGDPFVFGRGGEEAQALAAAGVPFEVVPGVTSAVAVPAYAGIPVTHRGLATSFTVVTGHSRHAIDTETNWEALAQAGGTIVILMGVAHRAAIADRLIGGGLDPGTPVAAVHWGTKPEQRTTRTTLGGLAAAELEPPATIVVGAVAGLDLGWFETRPLFGRKVVVTRTRDQASDAVSRLRDLGAEVIELPTIAIAPPDDGGEALRGAVAGLGAYDWVVFTSGNAVAQTLAAMWDARGFGAAKVAAVGSATADLLHRHGIKPDLVPERFVAEALVDAFPEGRGRVLLPQAVAARPVVSDGLAAKGWTVDVVTAYRTCPAQPSTAALDAAAAADAVMFTSSSTVTNYLALTDRVPPFIACIGPVTARTAEAAGLRVDVVAGDSTVASLVDALTHRLGA